jgi:phage regulator Rha-like protein
LSDICKGALLYKTRFHDRGGFYILLIAIELGIEHKNLLATIKEYKTEIEEDFERVAFETLSVKTAGGMQNITLAYLTEDQANYVMTLSKNTHQVRAAKLNMHRPQTMLEWAEAFVVSERARIAAEENAILLEAENLQLNKDVDRLSEVVDELFDYSSIIRIAKYCFW